MKLRCYVILLSLEYLFLVAIQSPLQLKNFMQFIPIYGLIIREYIFYGTDNLPELYEYLLNLWGEKSEKFSSKIHIFYYTVHWDGMCLAILYLHYQLYTFWRCYYPYLSGIFCHLNLKLIIGLVCSKHLVCLAVV